MTQRKRQGVVIVGAGPAGLAPLFAAANVGRLEEVLRLGVTVIEQRETVGGGLLGTYGIRSDSSAEALLDIVQRTEEPSLAALRSHPITQEMRRYGSGSAPLSLAGRFLQLAGEALCARIAGSTKGQVLRGHKALYARQLPGGSWLVRTQHIESGLEQDIETRSVVVALGAQQQEERLFREEVAGSPLLPRYAGKLMQSGAVLAADGAKQVARRLHGAVTPKVVIVGGSASAGAVAVSLLEHTGDISFGELGITLLHRRPIRITYSSVAEAVADGYTDFTAEDVCPLTGVVYRRGGFRLDSRELMMRVLEIGGRPREPRIELLRLSAETVALAQERLQRADLIIAAMGYRPGTLPLFDEAMHVVRVRTPNADQWSIVDQECRYISEHGRAVDGVFGIGLAVGPSFRREMGGEIGFRGQVNSLWMWQHTMGLRIVEGVLARTPTVKKYADVSRTLDRSVVHSIEGAA